MIKSFPGACGKVIEGLGDMCVKKDGQLKSVDDQPMPDAMRPDEAVGGMKPDDAVGGMLMQQAALLMPQALQQIVVGIADNKNKSKHAPKKCEHGRVRSRCVDCGGKGICEHKRIKRQCKECGGSSICEHKRQKSSCKECKGSSLCPHGRQKSRCKDCGGSGICEHGRQRRRCKECGTSETQQLPSEQLPSEPLSLPPDGIGIGLTLLSQPGLASSSGASHGASHSASHVSSSTPASQLCEHGRSKSRCKDCGGKSICEHNRRRNQCKACGGASICPHDRFKPYCKECKGSAICPHDRIKSRCRDCGGAALCEHQKRKSRCKQCLATKGALCADLPIAGLGGAAITAARPPYAGSWMGLLPGSHLLPSQQASGGDGVSACAVAVSACATASPGTAVDAAAVHMGADGGIIGGSSAPPMSGDASHVPHVVVAGSLHGAIGAGTLLVGPGAVAASVPPLEYHKFPLSVCAGSVELEKDEELRVVVAAGSGGGNGTDSARQPSEGTLRVKKARLSQARAVWHQVALATDDGREMREPREPPHLPWPSCVAPTNAVTPAILASSSSPSSSSSSASSSSALAAGDQHASNAPRLILTRHLNADLAQTLSSGEDVGMQGIGRGQESGGVEAVSHTSDSVSLASHLSTHAALQVRASETESEIGGNCMPGDVREGRSKEGLKRLRTKWGSLCEHNRERRRCVYCGGSDICVHRRVKRQCKECGGSSICEHKRQRSHCRECKGSSFCEHGRERYRCKDCQGHGICPHKRARRDCKECGFSAVLSLAEGVIRPPDTCAVGGTGATAERVTLVGTESTQQIQYTSCSSGGLALGARYDKVVASARPLSPPPPHICSAS